MWVSVRLFCKCTCHSIVILIAFCYIFLLTTYSVHIIRIILNELWWCWLWWWRLKIVHPQQTSQLDVMLSFEFSKKKSSMLNYTLQFFVVHSFLAWSTLYALSMCHAITLNRSLTTIFPNGLVKLFYLQVLGFVGRYDRLSDAMSHVYHSLLVGLYGFRQNKKATFLGGIGWPGKRLFSVLCCVWLWFCRCLWLDIKRVKLKVICFAVKRMKQLDTTSNCNTNRGATG